MQEIRGGLVTLISFNHVGVTISDCPVPTFGGKFDPIENSILVKNRDKVKLPLHL